MELKEPKLRQEIESLTTPSVPVIEAEDKEENLESGAISTRAALELMLEDGLFFDEEMRRILSKKEAGKKCNGQEQRKFDMDRSR